MVRRAELQTMRTTTELFSVCCFCIFVHLGQTWRTKRQLKSKPVSVDVNTRQGQNIAHRVSDKKRGCASGHYWTGNWSLEEMKGRGDLGGSADIDWTCELNGEKLGLTLQFELLLLDHRALVWEVMCNHILQVGRTARLRHRGGQDVCNCLLFLLKNKAFSRGIQNNPAPTSYKTTVSCYNSRGRHTHLSLLFRFVWLEIIWLFLLRN